jgi:hypothetical protein
MRVPTAAVVSEARPANNNDLLVAIASSQCLLLLKVEFLLCRNVMPAMAMSLGAGKFHEQ